MKLFKYFVLAFILAMPVNVFAGGGFTNLSNTDEADSVISAYYDLRDRSSYIQVTQVENNPACNIHVQIFQHDRGCSELNFFDTLTPNDTVVYDLDNLIKNNGEAVPANLQDDSSGYVVVLGDCDLIGNFRIIDDSGYEYRSNMPGLRRIDDFISNYIANFNTVNGANQADVVGYSYKFVADLPDRTVANFDEGWNYDIFVLDMNEEPLSCDTRNFACGNVMNYGINEDYPNSKGNDLLCPGGGLADPQGGYVSFENARLNVTIPPFNFMEESPIFTGLIGINNGDGTGSMDSWIEGEIFIPTF